MIQVAVEVLEEENVNPAPITALVRKTLEQGAVTGGEITVILADDDYLSRLKEEFFQRREYTDVIAFRLNDYAENQVEGEIYISLPRAKENSAVYGEPYPREVARLVVHGSLHLMGAEDETEEEKKAMRHREDAVLDRVDWTSILKSEA